MSGRLIACYSVFNDAALLERSFESVKPHVDLIAVVEGRYKGFPDENAHSTDGTTELCKKRADSLSLLHDLPQEIMRNEYLVGEPGDFYIVIDADEILAGNFSKDWVFGSGYDSIAVWVHDVMRGQACLSPKIYRHVEGIHHKRGNLLYDGKGRCLTSPPYVCGRTHAFRYDHLTAYRSEERQEQKRSYYRIQT